MSLVEVDPRSLIGRRVRAVIAVGGSASESYRAVVVGTVLGWERSAYPEPGFFLTLAGYGRVPVEACRPARWWHRG